MNRISRTRVERHEPAGPPPEVGDISYVVIRKTGTRIVAEALMAEQESVSLPVPLSSIPGPLTLLTRHFGPHLTIVNPAWGDHAVPHMRALQQRLVEFSLGLQPDDRTECMAAIALVERAVKLRLRLEQMRIAEADLYQPAELRTEAAER